MSAAVRRVALLAIFVAGACSVPERDNPFDPTRRPEAVLRVVTPEGGRGTPFVFDASSSRDPRDRGPLRFEWEIHDERYDTLPDDDGFDDFEDDTGDTIQVSFPNPFPLAFLSTNGEGSIPRRVRVKVIAADGAYDIAEGTVVVRNQRPIVDPGEDLFVSPLRTEPVLLDALGGGAEPTTLDEDEDDLRFTWTQVSGPEVTLTYDDPNRRRLASFDPPGDGRSITFLVTGSDGMASATDTVGVHFESQVWATTAFAARVYRIFPGFHYRTELLDAAGAPTTFATLSSFTVTSSGHLWTTESGGAGTTLVRRLSPDLRRISQTVIPGYARVMYAEASGEDLCLAMRVSTLATAGAFARIDASGGVEALTPRTGTLRVHALDADECWATSLDAAERFSDAGALTPVVTGLTSLTRSTVDAVGNLWFLVSVPTFTALGSTGPATSIRRVTPAGLVTTVFSTFDGSEVIDDIAPRSDGTIWVHDAERQLHVLAPDGTIRATDAPLIRLTSSLAAGRQLASDLDEEGLWFSDGQSGDILHVVDVGGPVRELGRLDAEQLGGTRFGSIGFGSGAVFTALAGAPTTNLVRVPGHGRAVQRVDVDLSVALPFFVAADGDRGALWISDQAPLGGRLLRMSDRGRLLAEIPISTWQLARRDDGVLAAMGVEPVTYEANLVMVSDTGAVLSTTPLGAGYPTALDLDPSDGARVCAALVGDALGDTRGVRIDPVADVVETLFTLAGVPYDDLNQIECVQDRADGATWFAIHDFAFNTTSIQRFAPGESLPSVVLTSAGVSAFTAFVAIDPDPVGGIWVGDNNTGFLYLVTEGSIVQGPDYGNFSHTSVVAPCVGPHPTDPDPANCREIWQDSTNGFGEKCMIRLRWSINDATIGDAFLDEWTIPVDSFIEGFAVAP